MSLKNSKLLERMRDDLWKAFYHKQQKQPQV